MTGDADRARLMVAAVDGRDPHAGGDGRDRDDPGDVVVVGAGPAGLTAAYQLAKAGIGCTVLEADDVVGGLSRTVVMDGYRFDIGGHRFFTKVRAVDELWREILPDDLLTRSRASRIYYRGKFFDYPLRPVDAMAKLGAAEAARCVLSYVAARLRPPRDQSTLEGYVAAKYGWRLYRHFFEGYTHEGLGHAGVGAVRRLGGAAHQGDVAVERALGAGAGTAPGAAPRRHQDGHEPDRALLLSAPRPRDDVGAVPRPRRGGREQGRRSTPPSPRSTTVTGSPSR